MSLRIEEVGAADTIIHAINMFIKVIWTFLHFLSLNISNKQLQGCKTPGKLENRWKFDHRHSLYNKDINRYYRSIVMDQNRYLKISAHSYFMA